MFDRIQQRCTASGKEPNESFIRRLYHLSRTIDPAESHMAMERMASYGKRVGSTVFVSLVWTGRFIEAWGHDYTDIQRQNDVCKHLTGRSRGVGDADIRAALIRRLGEPGTKSAPGPTFGVAYDAWQALGVAVTCADRIQMPLQMRLEEV